MGKTAMSIIWFFTKISSMIIERLNTPVLIIVVHLEFHLNIEKNLKKYFTNSKKNGMIKSLNSRESTAVRSKKGSYLINNKCYIYLMIF